jgi:hypothetical protein
MSDSSQALQGQLQLLRSLRGPGIAQPPRIMELKAWQAQRLRGTYLDLAAQPRYRAATAFFLEDMYGPKDFSTRDQSVLRLMPVMRRLLPATAVETAALAIELEALSESLDHRTVAGLPPGPVDGETYGVGYRAGSTRPERERQIALIRAVGERLEALVKKPLVARTLRLMRKPATLAGMQDLQDFLEGGFDAFEAIGPADQFLGTIEERETAVLNRLFSGRGLASSSPYWPLP